MMQQKEFRGPFHSGWLGIVALPDQITVQVAGVQARRYRAQVRKALQDVEGNEDEELVNPNHEVTEKHSRFPLITTPDARMHITLVQNRFFKNLPEDYVRTLLRALHESYAGAPLTHEKFVVRHGQFLFWQTGGGSIRDAHRLVLGERGKHETAQFIDPAAIERMVQQHPNASRAEQRNLKRFGLMYVDQQFAPHLTLSYRAGEVSLPKYIPREDFTMQRGIIDRFAFTRHGAGGVITEILAYSDRV